MAASQKYTKLISPNHLGSLGYQNFTIFKDQRLGRGSYGTVYRAEYDDLPCAAKVLHPTLVNGRTGGVVQRFEQECQVLSRIKHPNIVLYLGLRTDQASGLPVLLMELLDESLTKMLLHSPECLAYWLQVELCHNIALALSYLHSNNIIHRDLSGNNVLITAKRIAKVTDFGMSCIADHMESSKLTSCPGTACYMPPEAFNDHPSYTKPLDVFSFGVVVIQILTRLSPSPQSRTREVTQLQPKGRYQIIVPEQERRQEHIAMVQPTNNPLLKTALDCIRDNPSKRPVASNLCRMLQELKRSPAFVESKKQEDGGYDQLHASGEGDGCSTSNRPTPENSRLQEYQEKEREILGLHQQLREKESLFRAQQIDMKQKQAALKEFAHEAQYLREMNHKLRAELVLKEGELQQNRCALRNMKETCRLQMEERVEATKQVGNRSILEETQRDINKKDTISLTETVSESESRIEDSQTIVHDLQEIQLQEKHYSPAKPSRVQLKYQSYAPMSISRGASVLHGSVVYITFRDSILTYDIHSQIWNRATDCPQANGGFTIIGELPTMVGGEKGGHTTRELVSLMDGYWVETFPRMPTPRTHSSAVMYEDHLIVVGGSSSTKLGMDILAVVEVMDISNYQTEQAWSCLTSLPHPLACASVAIHKGHMILQGGIDRTGVTLINLTCDIPSLLNSNKPPTRNAKGPKAIGKRIKRALDPTSKRNSESTLAPVWKRLANSRKYQATCVSLGSQLLAVGGYKNSEEADTSMTVDHYNVNGACWEEIGSVGSRRWLCHATRLSDNVLMVVGGLQKHSCEAGALSSNMELLTIDTNNIDYVYI